MPLSFSDACKRFVQKIKQPFIEGKREKSKSMNWNVNDQFTNKQYREDSPALENSQQQQESRSPQNEHGSFTISSSLLARAVEQPLLVNKSEWIISHRKQQPPQYIHF